jgi:TonB family protein
MRCSLSCVLFFSLASVYLGAQSSVTITAPSVDSATAMESRTTYVAAIFPPIAKAAHVTGTVVLQIEIESDGSVGKVKIISGPPMLNGAAVEAVKQWRYKPFVQEESPATVSTTVSLPFLLDKIPADNDNAIQSAFFPLSDGCHKAVAQNTSPAQQPDICRRAAEVADQFAPDSRFIERRSAFTYASTALLRNREAKEALHFAEKAVAVHYRAMTMVLVGLQSLVFALRQEQLRAILLDPIRTSPAQRTRSARLWTLPLAILSTMNTRAL